MTTVVDTGVAVPSQAVKSLSAPFTQLDNSATKRDKGTGLGLSICQSLVRIMEGTIGYRPDLDRLGSVFWFTVKLIKLNEKPILAPPVGTPNKEMTEMVGGKQVLLDENNIITQTIMVKLLRSFGFEKVNIALDSAQAVQLVRIKSLAYDVILVDISMPVLDGIGTTAEIKKWAPIYLLC